MSIQVHTIQITSENVDRIEAAALTQDWHLDHLKDNLEYHEGEFKTEPTFKTLVLYITVDETGRIMNCNDVPFFDDSHEKMDHIDTDALIALIEK